MVTFEIGIKRFTGNKMLSDAQKTVRSIKADYRYGDWIEMMDTVKSAAPFLFGKGRPKKTDIENSFIGQSGYRSWTAFIEVELLWNSPGWLLYKRAYRLVLKYPYLRDLDVSASIINVRFDNEDTFPSTAEEWQSIQQRYKRKTRSDKINALENQIKKLEYKLIELNEKVNKLCCEKVV